MKINKIENQLEINEEVELQGCSTDCKEYFGKTKANVITERSQGLLAGTARAGKLDSASAIRDWKNATGYYCYEQLTGKGCYLW